MFIRFAILKPDARAPQGIFGAAYDLLWESELSPIEYDHLADLLGWFNINLPVPTRYRFNERGIFWFKDSDQSRESIRRIWQLAHVLREHGCVVRLFKSHHPGRVVYEDDYQVAAIPARHSYAYRCRREIGRKAYLDEQWRRFFQENRAAWRAACRWRRLVS